MLGPSCLLALGRGDHARSELLARAWSRRPCPVRSTCSPEVEAPVLVLLATLTVGRSTCTFPRPTLAPSPSDAIREHQVRANGGAERTARDRCTEKSKASRHPRARCTENWRAPRHPRDRCTENWRASRHPRDRCTENSIRSRHPRASDSDRAQVLPSSASKQHRPSTGASIEREQATQTGHGRLDQARASDTNHARAPRAAWMRRPAVAGRSQ